MHNVGRLGIAIAMVGALATGSPVLAQGAGPSGAAPSDRSVEQRIMRLHGQLKITPAEHEQWDSFASVMRANAEGFRQAADNRGSKLASMTAPQIMQSYAELAQTHAEQMQKLQTSFQTLYDSFSAEQKQVADQVFRLPRPGSPRPGRAG